MAYKELLIFKSKKKRNKLRYTRVSKHTGVPNVINRYQHRSAAYRCR